MIYYVALCDGNAHYFPLFDRDSNMTTQSSEKRCFCHISTFYQIHLFQWLQFYYYTSKVTEVMMENMKAVLTL